MGLDITVLAVDWKRLERTPFEERYALLEDAALPGDELDWDAEPERGWVWPAASSVPWCGRYEFHSTTGSYKPHFWAGQAWEDVREHAGPEQRAHLDAFLQGLIWDNGTGTEDDTVCGLFAADPDPWHRRLLLACPPATVSALAGHWARAEPLLESLREPYGVHAACPGRWIEDFDEFSVLLREWGVVVTEAGRRGWGLIGLPL
ncbi:hypothetical protein [Streptomyces azureus]|uniref:Uncharacterized protein n=1 Tax=Streptomyces azureus TaxID=146537 RepID=A0A0K8PTI5_STRAJ|nr:hypothetical protein [Streptomyces azureus]GAP51116.1 uncharacterized protein SAZU_5976 [Streptomyces azureus]